MNRLANQRPQAPARVRVGRERLLRHDPAVLKELILDGRHDSVLVAGQHDGYPLDLESHAAFMPRETVAQGQPCEDGSQERPCPSPRIAARDKQRVVDIDLDPKSIRC